MNDARTPSPAMGWRVLVGDENYLSTCAQGDRVRKGVTDLPYRLTGYLDPGNLGCVHYTVWYCTAQSTKVPLTFPKSRESGGRRGEKVWVFLG